MELLAGTGFENGTTPAEGEPQPIIVNETAVQSLGFDTPEEAINQDINIGDQPNRIMGVFKDFSWSSAHNPRESVIFVMNQGNDLHLRIT